MVKVAKVDVGMALIWGGKVTPYPFRKEIDRRFTVSILPFVLLT